MFKFTIFLGSVKGIQGEEMVFSKGKALKGRLQRISVRYLVNKDRKIGICFHKRGSNGFKFLG